MNSPENKPGLSRPEVKSIYDNLTPEQFVEKAYEIMMPGFLIMRQKQIEAEKLAGKEVPE